MRPPRDESAPGAAQPWRADDALGARAGLRAYQDQLRAGGRSSRDVAVATAGIGVKVASMVVRGAVARPRFRSAAGIPLVGRGVRLRGLNQVEIGRRLRIEDHAEIQGASRQGIRIGDNVTIGPFAAIRPSNYYGRSLGVGLSIGDRTSIGANCYLGCLGGVTLGSDIMLAPGVMIFAESHVFDSAARTIKSQGVEARPVVIEDDCWIASGVIITGGVRIGAGSVVGAGAVVTRDVPPGTVVVGNPARVVRERSTGDAAS